MITTNKERSLVIIGSGGQGANIASIAIDSGFIVDSFVDEIFHRKEYLGFRVYNSFDHIKDINRFNYAIGIGENFKRQKLFLKLQKRFPEMNFPIIKHPSSVVSSFASLNQGSILMPNTVVGSNASIGRFCILGNQSCLGHDSAMSDFSSLGPGSITGGSVLIGKRSSISMRASIKQGIKVQQDTILGSSSYLNKNLTKNIIAFGIPAKRIRERDKEEPYL